jgi:hypothetical protein
MRGAIPHCSCGALAVTGPMFPRGARVDQGDDELPFRQLVTTQPLRHGRVAAAAAASHLLRGEPRPVHDAAQVPRHVVQCRVLSLQRTPRPTSPHDHRSCRPASELPDAHSTHCQRGRSPLVECSEIDQAHYNRNDAQPKRVAPCGECESDSSADLSEQSSHGIPLSAPTSYGEERGTPRCRGWLVHEKHAGACGQQQVVRGQPPQRDSMTFPGHPTGSEFDSQVVWHSASHLCH